MHDNLSNTYTYLYWKWHGSSRSYNNFKTDVISWSFRIFWHSSAQSTTHKKCPMNEMVEHVRAYVFKSIAYLKSDDLQMLDGAPTDCNILEIDKIGRENRRKYYEKYLECGNSRWKMLDKTSKSPKRVTPFSKYNQAPRWAGMGFNKKSLTFLFVSWLNFWYTCRLDLRYRCRWGFKIMSTFFYQCYCSF